jgi:hypothetical protein
MKMDTIYFADDGSITGKHEKPPENPWTFLIWFSLSFIDLRNWDHNHAPLIETNLKTLISADVVAEIEKSDWSCRTCPLRFLSRPTSVWLATTTHMLTVARQTYRYHFYAVKWPEEEGDDWRCRCEGNGSVWRKWVDDWGWFSLQSNPLHIKIPNRLKLVAEIKGWKIQRSKTQYNKNPNFK